jgi:hypothetical protein
MAADFRFLMPKNVVAGSGLRLMTRSAASGIYQDDLSSIPAGQLAALKFIP